MCRGAGINPNNQMNQTKNKYTETEIRQAGIERGLRFLADVARDIPITYALLYKYCRDEAPVSDETRDKIEGWMEAKR